MNPFTQHTVISETEFEDKYGPLVPDEEGNNRMDCVDADEAYVERAHAERRLWTATLEEGQWYYTAGYRYVNREYYVFATRPYPEGADIVVECEKIPYCVHCDSIHDAPDDEPCWSCGKLQTDEVVDDDA